MNADRPARSKAATRRVGLIPRALPAELERPRLQEVLEGSQDLKLIALIAPSGYGKTTLLAQFARDATRRVVWLNLNADNADPDSLAQTLTEALANEVPGLTSPTPTAQTRLRADRLARSLDQAEENITLILEGVDQLGLDAGRWLHVFIEALSEGHQVLFSGYEVTALPIARYLSAGIARIIGPDELSFTPEESATYLQSRSSKLDPGAAHRELEGWPAGLALAASGASLGLGPSDLVQEVLEQLPGAVRERIGEAAVLNVWSEEAARRLGLGLPRGWLHEVHRIGLPLTPLGGGASRPHKLLLEMLELELRGRPERHRELHQAAAHAAEASGDVLQALEHYLTAGLEADALSLAARIVERYVARWEYRLVRQVLEAFPEDHLPPALAAMLGRALVETREVVRGEALLRRLRAEGHDTIETVIGLCVLAEYRGEHDEHERLMAEGLTLARSEQGRINLKRHQATLTWAKGNFEQSLAHALEIVRWAEAHNDLNELSIGLALAQSALGPLGRLGECERYGRRALEIFEALGLPARVLGAMSNMANLYCYQDRFMEALQVLEKAILIAEREEHTIQPHLLALRGDVYFWQADFERAASEYQVALRRCGGLGVDRLAQEIRLKFTDAAARAGQHEAAAKAMMRAREKVPPSGTPLHHTFEFHLGLEAFAAGRLEEARRHFEVLEPPTTEAVFYARALAHLAEIERREGTLRQEHVSRLMQQLSILGRDSVLRIDAEPLGALYAECVRQGWWPERFARYATNLPEVVLMRPAGLELRLTSLGAVRAELDGTGVHIPLTKAGELLVWLAWHGPGTREQIMGALWEGSIEQRHLEYFKISVRRMRAALAEHPSVTDFNPLPFEAGHYRLSERFTVQLDAMAIASALQTGEVRDLQRALEAHTGEFMPGSESEWAGDMRLRLQEQALEAAMTLGAKLEVGRPSEAIRAYRRAVELEPLHEPAHLALIRTLAKNDLPAAQRAFNAYARMLGEEYGTTPKPELRRMLELP